MSPNPPALIDEDSFIEVMGDDWDALKDEVHEQWCLQMLAAQVRQERIRMLTHKTPAKQNRVLGMVPDVQVDAVLNAFFCRTYGPDWMKDPDKLRFVRKLYPIICPNVEKPMDRVGWTRAQEARQRGVVLTDRRGGVL